MITASVMKELIVWLLHLKEQTRAFDRKHTFNLPWPNDTRTKVIFKQCSVLTL